MIYTKEDFESIEKVKNVFAGYMADFKEMDLVYSEKAGYVLLFGIRLDEGRLTMDPIFITDGAHLCDFLLYEIACAEMTRITTPSTFKDIHEATEEEKVSIIKAFAPYMDQLPEYEYLIEKQFNNPWKE